ncbi:ABC-type branched-chain amino acid transport systems, ATPase component [Desulfosporosinus orientis DSM 765]|uniref:ABC-type branched-chain amino acid transport systems, ATPase component n=1 Tax=Desulfosporosinus orientis (strain ATCC 19365 / DSM 765 / NCIMB 8382 / VKM B-1628 / Singapore I) TaxID=768706 RepID=G7WE35_DESOD|nr:ABC transporter ATP-binding protein [Desulfosporosinus orientis]AET69433.1 ABC-type branched-chain amino acid transport systems, ATPase component [Desulfosporosinus orientis DSM 765]
MSLLSLNNVTIRFGGLTAVDTVNLEVKQGEILALIGPNGAGKSTVFNLITGIYKPTEGEITLAGKSLAGVPTHKVAEMGITRTFQTIRLFTELSVLDNVKIGAHCSGKAGLFHALTRVPGMKREEAEITEKSLEALQFLDLVGKREELAKNLSYGEQRRLEIARALVSKPKILLLDEPAAGMNPQEKVVLMDMIRKIRDTGITIFLVEHDMKLVMGISERIAVLDYGKLIAEGLPQEVRSNKAVIEAYLGSGKFKSRIRR